MAYIRQKWAVELRRKQKLTFGRTFVMFVAIPTHKNLFQVNNKMMKKVQRCFLVHWRLTSTSFLLRDKKNR